MKKILSFLCYLHDQILIITLIKFWSLIQSKMKVQERSQHYIHQFLRRSRAANSKIGDGIWRKVKLIQAIMVVLVTCKRRRSYQKWKCYSGHNIVPGTKKWNTSIQALNFYFWVQFCILKNRLLKHAVPGIYLLLYYWQWLRSMSITSRKTETLYTCFVNNNFPQISKTEPELRSFPFLVRHLTGGYKTQPNNAAILNI